MKEKLQQIGLNSTEIDIYLALLEHGKITPANISRITGINRSTTYAAADELKKKGIIEEDLSGKTKYLIALPPERLTDSSTGLILKNFCTKKPPSGNQACAI